MDKQTGTPPAPSGSDQEGRYFQIISERGGNFVSNLTRQDPPLTKEIRRLKQTLGDRLNILAHHYQTDDIVRFANFIGDSLELARCVAMDAKAELIVFCGVYFMAETAVILAPHKKVYIPTVDAGCPLADMARIEDVEVAWEVVHALGPIIPLTYVNSSAAIKAFCGRHGGAVCTSGNARAAFAWALMQADKIFFMPDMNLGRNTAQALGIDPDAIMEWDPANPGDQARYAQAKVILWKGWCPVHWPNLEVSDIETMRSVYPGAKVIVHPESDPATVQASDASASTAGIIKYVENLPLGETVAVGTEINMVRRLANSFHDIVTVIPLRGVKCDDMAKITVEDLARCLAEFPEEMRVRVPEDIIKDARLALDRMLSF